MTTNLQIGYPDIPFNSTSINVSDSYSSEEKNLVTGSRSIVAKAANNITYTNEFEFVATSTANYFALTRAKLLKKAGVTSVILRGSNGSITAPSVVTGAQLWIDATKKVTRDSTTNKATEIFDRTANNYKFEQTTAANQPILTRADNKANWCLYSEQFDNAAWSKASVTVTANNIADPNGTLTADKITCSAGNAQHYVGELSPTLGAGIIGKSYRLSVYLKYGNYQYIQILESGDGTIRAATVDLINNTISAGTGVTATSITAIGSGWYRATITFTRTTNNNITLAFAFDNTSGSTSIPTWLAAGTEYVYLWGAQFQESDADTTYLQTTSAQEFQGVNGNRTLRFFGSQSLGYNLGGTPAGLNITTDISIFAVIKPNNADLATNYVICSCESLNASGYIFRIDPVSSNFTPKFRTSQAGANTFAAGTTSSIALNTTQLLGAQRNGGTTTHYLNGSANGSGAVSNPVAPTALFQIGAGSGQLFSGNICEIIIFNSNLGTTDRQKIEAYLTGKWITAPAYQNHDLQTTTLQGVNQEDLFASFNTTSSYPYWAVTFESLTANKRPLSKIYIGNLFDLGRDPNYDMKTNRSYVSEDAPQGAFEFDLSWTGITNTIRNSFESKIGKWRRENPIYLYQTSYTGHVFSYNPIMVQLVKYEWEPKENSMSNLRATFREVY